MGCFRPVSPSSGDSAVDQHKNLWHTACFRAFYPESCVMEDEPTEQSPGTDPARAMSTPSRTTTLMVSPEAAASLTNKRRKSWWRSGEGAPALSSAAFSAADGSPQLAGSPGGRPSPGSEHASPRLVRPSVSAACACRVLLHRWHPAHAVKILIVNPLPLQRWRRLWNPLERLHPWVEERARRHVVANRGPCSPPAVRCFTPPLSKRSSHASRSWDLSASARTR